MSLKRMYTMLILTCTVALTLLVFSVTTTMWNSFIIREKAKSVPSHASSIFPNGSRNTPTDHVLSVEVVQLSRQHVRRQACSSLGFYENAIYGNRLPNSNYLMHFHVSEKYKTAICLIPKVGSSSWVRTLLLLEDVYNTTEGMAVRDINRAAKRHIKTLRRFGKRAGEMLRNYMTIIFVRNPYTRLLSAFRDRLEQYPNRNLSHRKRHNKKIYTMFGNHSADEMPGPSVKSEKYNVTFRAFVDYYLSGKKDVHWREQHKVCAPCIDYDYIAKIETYADDYNQIMAMIGADQKVPLASAPHATNSSEDAILRQYYDTLSNEQFKKLGDILRPDMELFGYSIPEMLKRN